MNTALIASLISFAFISSATPGPNNLLLMSSGALFGWRRTLPHLGGILLGFAVVMSSAVFGLGTLVDQWPWLVTIVRVLGASWLAWMSIRFFRVSLKGDQTTRRVEKAPIARPFRFYEAMLFQWINPKAIIAALSSAGAYIAISDQVWQRAVVIVGVFFVAGLIGCSTWMIAGNALNRYMSSGRSAPYVNGAMGVLILATAVFILLG